MRYMGLDLGTRTLGIAISDSLGMMANPLKTIRYNKVEELVEPLKSLIDEYEVNKIALGLPKNMNNSLGFASERSIKFKDFMESKLGLSIDLVDERLTTVEAERYLLATDMSRRKRKEHIDAVAACIILDTYMKMKGKE